jgi:hypothetical protein
MPGSIRKLPHSSKVRVRWGGKVVSYRTTRKKGEAQLRLLRSREGK